MLSEYTRKLAKTCLDLISSVLFHSKLLMHFRIIHFPMFSELPRINFEIEMLSSFNDDVNLAPLNSGLHMVSLT